MAAPEVRILTAPGDGTGPSALLTLPHVRPAIQYLFRAPDGMSRLVLEQGQRPGLGLRAIFTCNRGYSQVRAVRGCLCCASHSCQSRASHNFLPPQQGGLAGLLMRLRADGNEQVHLLGPQGGDLDGFRWVGGRPLAC